MLKKDLLDLVEEIKSISINNSDLLDIVLFYGKKMSAKLSEKESKLLDDLFVKEAFISHSFKCVKESIVLAIQSIILEESVSFEKLLSEIISLDEDRSVSENIGAEYESVSLRFFSLIRKSIYKRTILENIELIEFSNVDRKKINEREKSFKNYIKVTA